MVNTYQNEEILENGTKMVTLHDHEKHALLGFYHLNSDGKKHGLEVEYDGKGGVSAIREYKNGVCEKSDEYNVPVSSIRDYLEKNTLAHNLFEDNFVCYIAKENDQYKHIEIKNDQDIVYNMDFENGKEYNGYLKCTPLHYEPGEYRKYKYTYLNGDLYGEIITKEIDGKYMGGNFSGKKYIPLEESTCKKYLPQNIVKSRVNQEYINGKIVSETAYYGFHKGQTSFEYSLYLPKSGKATLTELFIHGEDNTRCFWQTKDWKKNGKQMKNNIKTTYVDDILDGPCIEYYGASCNRKAEYSYKQGKIDGAYTEFFASTDYFASYGAKKIEGFYKDGQKNGVWKYYSEDGNLINTELWKDGKNETEKYAAIKKIATKHTDDKKATTKIGKAIQKGLKAAEVSAELIKSKTKKERK